MKRMYTGTNWFRPFQEGDQDAYAWMFGLFYRDLLGYADNKLLHDPMAEDIVLNVFRKVYEEPDRFKSVKHLEYFFYTVTSNDCISYLRRLDRYRKILRSRVSFSEIDDADHETELLYEEMRSEMHQKVKFLPPDKRAILELSLENKSNAEIAAILDLRLSEVPVKKFRARKALKALLTGSGLLLSVSFFAFTMFFL
jgi:RNA polymerase sigma-70 factor (ECF subfamily)